MTKLWIVAAVCVAAFLQVAIAQDVPLALSNGVREPSQENATVLAVDEGSNKEDLQRVIIIRDSDTTAENTDVTQATLEGVIESLTPELNKPTTVKLEQDQVNDNINGATETSGLKSETVVENQATLEVIAERLTPELNRPVTESLYENRVNDNTRTAMDFIQSLFNGSTENNSINAETIDEKPVILEDVSERIIPQFNLPDENQLNENIKIAREFYQSLLDGAPGHKVEVEKTIAILENLLKETDFNKQQGEFLSFEMNFSPEFQTFLRDNSAPWLDRNLRMIRGFLEYLIDMPNEPFKSEITALKVSADVALAKSASVDDKKKTLYKIFHPDNQELDGYLKRVLPN